MTAAAPLVGISALPRDVQGSKRAYPGHTIDVWTPLAIERAGGVPLLLPRVAAARAAAQVAPLAALVLSGGHDVDAALYGREPVPEMEGVDPARDAWELALIAAARERGLPILGVCRGAQLLNVERGGSLHRHLDAADAHRLDMLDPDGRHDVRAVPGTVLAGVLGTEPLAVASYHHQAVDLPGRGARVSAWAPDGVIEAIELHDGSELGVQWHPEFQLDEAAGQPLFDWLLSTVERDV